MQSPNSSISNFKRFTLAILLPLIITIAIAGYLFSYVFEQKIILSNPLNGVYKINRILAATDPGEIPIFGSSRAAYVYIPDSLGDHYFNYGLAGIRDNVTLFFLEQECKKAKTTAWIIANIDLEGLACGLGDVSNYILNSNEPHVRSLLGDAYKPYFSVPFIRYFGRYENYLRLYLSNKTEMTKLTNKGAAIEKNVLSEDQFNQLVETRKHTATTFKVAPELSKQLFDLIAAHPERRFLFIISPYHSSYFAKYVNLNDANDFLKSLAANKNVTVLNYSQMPLPDSMFLNTTHINLKGALVFNRQIKDTLLAMGVR